MGILDWIGAIVAVLGGTGIIVGALAYVLRKLGEQWLEFRLEDHKSRLEAANEQAIEEFRSTLRMTAFEHETRFRHLHERQAEAIADVYGTMLVLYQKVASYISWLEWSGEPSKAEKHKEVIQAVQIHSDAFYPRRIFFPKDIAERIESLNRMIADITNEFMRGLERDKKGMDPSEEDHWMKSRKALEEKAYPLFREIEDHFQRLLGISQTRRCEDSEDG